MTTRTLAGQITLVSGGSRGIGLAIAQRAARDRA
jgi:NAD(P)-dependent dehydrogenase (short-subunit alcohol dehydrogenase family)